MKFGINLGFRARFVIVTLLIVVAVDLAAGVYLQWKLRATAEQRIEDELSRHARTGRELFRLGLEHGSIVLAPTSIDPIADQLGASMAARVTIIGSEGTVLGDSNLTLAELSTVENHGDRPEVLAAGADSCGLSRRHSVTLGTDMLYCAMILDVPGDAGPAFVRVSTPLELLDDSFARVRLILVFGGLLSLGLAIGAGLVASRAMYGKVRELAESARAMADKDHLLVPGADDFDGAAGSLNRVSRELERTVKQLARERDLFEAVIHSMGEAVLAIDKKRRIIAVNRSAREVLSISTEVRGRLLLDAVRIPQLAEALDHALRGESRSIDIELESAGSLRQLMVRATPQGESGGAVLVMHDVTEIRRLETVRRDFVANVSHELRTPVSVIQANTETLLSGALDEPVQARRFLDAIRRNAERLGQLISDLLDISRIEAGKYEIDMCALSIASLARSVEKSVSESCRRRDVVFHIDVSSDLQVYGDARALEQVLVNLIENAVKYGPEGGEVELAAVEQAAAVRIEVRDRGPGIAPDQRSRVFERFYRVDPGRSRHMGGTGLGLAIVKNLTEAMGGDVGVDPRQPSGSCFWVRLGKVTPTDHADGRGTEPTPTVDG